jgi:hypothetical protein
MTIATTTISEKGPTWAVGCYECKFGVHDNNPRLDVGAELYLTRLGAFLNGDLELCSCKAGQLYRIYLLNLERRFIEEAQRHPMMGNTHPEVENIRRRLRNE